MEAEAERSEFLGLQFDPMDQGQAVSALLGARSDAPFRYLVTPNVDHMLRVVDDPAVAQLYRDAWLCLNDSRILACLARVAGVDLPATPGSDLVAALLKHPDFSRDAEILIVGGEGGMAQALAADCDLNRVTQLRPPMGLRRNPAALAKTVADIEARRVRFVLLAIGSPQQEMVAAALAAGGRATGVGLCIGAGLDFLIGTRRRAPLVMQRAGLEWLFRLACEPGRLARRYLVEGPRIFLIFWRYIRQPRLGTNC